MSRNIRSSLAAIVATVGMTAMGMDTPARAGLVIQLSTDGVNWSTVESAASGTATSYTNATYHGFDISLLSTDSNSQGSSSLAYLEGAATHVENIGSASATLYITLSDTGFVAPMTPPGIVLDSQIGGAVLVPGVGNSLTFQSFVNPADGQNSLAGFTTGPQTPGITGSPMSYSDDTSMTIASGLTTTYSITEYLTITLSAGSQVGFQSSTNLSSLAPASVPEPSGLVLAGISVLGVAGYAVRRRARRRPDGETAAGGAEFGPPGLPFPPGADRLV